MTCIGGLNVIDSYCKLPLIAKIEDEIECSLNSHMQLVQCALIHQEEPMLMRYFSVMVCFKHFVAS